MYYVSPPRPDVTFREKARFVSRPTDPPHPGLDALRLLRVQRRLTPEDCNEHVPEFTQRWPETD